jgi:tripartite motif-containing protein 71
LKHNWFSGFIYVCDTGNQHITKLNRKGELILKWGEEGTLQAQFDYPRDIAVDSSGFIYVYDTNNHRIQKFNSNGKFVLFIGTPR